MNNIETADTDNNFEDNSLTHEELSKVTKCMLNELLRSNPILQDLPPDITVEEVEAQTAVIHGQSICVIVKRGEDDNIPVIVKRRNSTVSDLKRAFQRAMRLKLRRDNERYKISWRHIWRVYLFSCDGLKLDSNHGLLRDYGIVNKSEVTFVPKMKAKSKPRRRHIQGK